VRAQPRDAAPDSRRDDAWVGLSVLTGNDPFHVSANGVAIFSVGSWDTTARTLLTSSSVTVNHCEVLDSTERRLSKRLSASSWTNGENHNQGSDENRVDNHKQ
jgi:hypothetical protein